MSVANNSFEVNQMVFKGSLLFLNNTLSVTKSANRNYQADFTQGRGTSVRVAIPVRALGRDFNTIVTAGSIVENFDTLSLDLVAGADFEISQVQMSRDITQLGPLYIKPQMIVLANLVDAGLESIMRLGFSQVTNINADGSIAGPVNSYAIVDQCRVRMENMAIPYDDTWYLQMNPNASGALRSGVLASYFTPVANEKILMKGSLNMIDNFQAYTDQIVSVHTTGTFAGTPVVSGADQSGTTLNLSGFTHSATGVLLAGDIIFITGVGFVNPESRTPTGTPTFFTVQDDVDADAGGNVTVTINPPIYGTTPEASSYYQNVTELPADGAAVHCVGKPTGGVAVTYPINYFYCETGLTLAAPSYTPNAGAVFSAIESTDTGVAVAMNIAYTFDTNVNQYRWDVYYGGFAFNAYGGRMVG